MDTETRRRTYRKPFRYPAFLDCGDGKGLMPCSLTDLSPTGVRIYLPGDSDLPKFVTLVLTERGAGRRDCQVMWCSQTEIGLQYVNPERAGGTAKLAGTLEPDNRIGESKAAYRGAGQRFTV